MKITRTARLFPFLMLLALFLPAAGCSLWDWMTTPSGSEARVSPVIDTLVVAPPGGVLCTPTDKDPPYTLTIAFGYSDPQDDIYLVRLTFEHTQPDSRIERTVLWTEMDLTTGGTAVYRDFYFECGGPPKGTWTLTVQVEDDLGHLSNDLTGDVTLLSD